MLRQSYLGDWFGPAPVDDAVQPSNESRRTAPPAEPAADHAIHVEEGTAAPSNHSPNDWANLSSKSSLVCSILLILGN